METVESKVPSDRLSNLPNSVAETILTYMPLRDAVRTSILSKKWRHVWAKLPQFVLDQTFWENVGVQCSVQRWVIRILFQLFSCHDGPIIKFTLSNPKMKSFPEIDNLISFLMKSDIEDLTLEMWKDCYLLPYSIFSCQKLRHLSLKYCSIRDFASVGYSRLTSLKLIQVTISAETLASLISAPPLLGLLEIETSSHLSIRIDAPNLETIIIRGLVNSIHFERVPLLSSVSMLNTPEDEVIIVGVESNIIKFIDCFPALRTLKLSFQVVQSFGAGMPIKLPTYLVQLIHVNLSGICCDEMVELSFTLCLLRSSPNLKYIQISFAYLDFNSEEGASYIESGDFSDLCLSELQEVKLDEVVGTNSQLEFVRLLLAKSSSLKKIQIRPTGDVDDKGLKFLKEVIKFRRLSREAEIIYDE